MIVGVELEFSLADSSSQDPALVAIDGGHCAAEDE
jgi:hypothetical protein